MQPANFSLALLIICFPNFKFRCVSLISLYLFLSSFLNWWRWGRGVDMFATGGQEDEKEGGKWGELTNRL